MTVIRSSDSFKELDPQSTAELTDFNNNRKMRWKRENQEVTQLKKNKIIRNNDIKLPPEI